MLHFFGGVAFLILGYFTYGRIVDRLIGTDGRDTPCIAHPDGVDYVPLPKLKNLLIQLLNIAIVAALLWWSNLSPKSFGQLWNYFAWGNQLISATMLMCATVWMIRQGKKGASCIMLIPGVFMTTVVGSFIFWTPGTGGQPWGLVPGGLPLGVSIAIGVVLAIAFAIFACYRGKSENLV